MAAADAIDIAPVRQVVGVEAQRQVRVDGVRADGAEDPVARDVGGVDGVAKHRVHVLGTAAQREVAPDLVGGPEAERALRRQRQVGVNLGRGVRGGDVAVHVGVAGKPGPPLAQRAGDAHLDALHDLLSRQHRRRIAGIHAGRAGVGLLRPEQGGVDGQPLTREIPLRPHLVVARLLRLEVHRAGGQRQPFSRWIECRRVAEVDAAVGPRLVDGARAPAHHLVDAGQRRRRAAHRHRGIVDVEAVPAEAAGELPAIRHADRVERVGTDRVGASVGIGAVAREARGISHVRIGIEEIGVRRQRRVRPGFDARIVPARSRARIPRRSTTACRSNPVPKCPVRLVWFARMSSD